MIDNIKISEPSCAKRATVVVVAIILLVVHAAVFLPFLTDDALISLRYVHRFLAGLGLTWSDGPRVEGYSNLLWVLMTAGLGRTGIPLVSCLRILGVLCHVGVIAALAWEFLRARIDAFVFAAIVFVLSIPVAVWTIGGLEQPLVAVLLAWALVLCLARENSDASPDRVYTAGLMLGLLCLTRPDGALYTVALFPGLIARERYHGRSGVNALRLLVIPIVCYLGQMLFRLSYYGDWVPNTAHIKISPSLHHAVQGSVYALGFYLSLAPAVIVCILHAVRTVRNGGRVERVRLFQIGCPMALWTLYVIFIGGDIFPAFRHGVPLVVCLAILTGEAIRTGSIALPRLAGQRRMVVAVFAIVYVLTNYASPSDRSALSEDWEWESRDVGLGLRRLFPGQEPTIAVDAAGSLPFWCEFPAIDMLGLNDWHIARTIPANFGEGRIGHEKGDGAYVLARRPDMIFFNFDLNIYPVYRTGRDLFASPAFFRDYLICRFAVKSDGRHRRQVRFYAWIERDSPLAGYPVSKEGDYAIPSYFFTGIGKNCAVIDETGAPKLTLADDGPGTFAYADAIPGHYRVIVHSNKPAHIRIVDPETQAVYAEGTQELDVNLPVNPAYTHGMAVFNLSLSPEGSPSVTIDSVDLKRLDPLPAVIPTRDSIAPHVVR